MINQNINAQLDQLIGDKPSVDESLPLSESDSIFTGETEQVAGVGKIILEKIPAVIKKSISRIKVPDNIPTEELPKIDTTTLPKSEVVKESDAIQLPSVQPTAPQTKPLTKKQQKIQQTIDSAEQFTPEQLIIRQNQEAEKIAKMREEGKRLIPGELTFNYDVLNTTDDVSALIEANAKMYGIKTENITFDEVIESAKDIGFNKKFIETLMSGEIKVNNELARNSYQTNKLIKILQTDLNEKMLRVKNGDVTEKEMIAMMKDISFNGILLQNAKNYKTNLGQGLGILKAKVEDIENIGDLSGLKSVDDFKRFAEKYLNSNQETQNKLIQGVTVGKTIDKLSMIYVGGLLSRPGTHVKNIASTLSAVPLRWANKSTAAGFDIARYNFGKLIGQDVSRSVYFSETLSEVVATKQALLNGFEAARFAYKNGYRIDALEASKFEVQKMDIDIFDTKEGSPFAGFAKFFNYAAKTPGKALFIADEFLKGVNYTYELESYITRQSIKAHDDVLINKGTIEEAAAAYDQMASSIIDNPPDFIHDLAAEDVFLKPLEPGKLKTFKDITNDASLSSYLIKTQVPFLQTPTNLYSQVFEEIPVLAFATKKARQDIASGDPARIQMAVAKQSTGLGLMYLASNFAVDGSITGPGPADKAEFKRLIDQGWKPYSIVIDLSSLTTERRKKYNEDGRLVKGKGDYEGKYFFSYEGLEPIGALLAIGASYAEYAKYNDNADELNSFIYGALPGVAEYAVSHPMLEGVQRIGKLVTDITNNLDEQKADKLINDFISYTMEIGYKSTIPLSGFQKSTAEAIDPYQRDYKLNGDEHPLLAGVLQGYKKIASNVPGLSASLPRKINIWNEPLTNDTAWSPLRASKGKALEANEILVATRTPYGAPSNRVEKTLDNIPVAVKMTDNEYRELIAIANDELMMSERIISKAEDLGESIDLEAIKGTPVQLKRVQKALSTEMESVFAKAREILIERSPEIQQRLMDEVEKANQITVESSQALGI